MATISITTPSDGQTIDASDVATPLNTIVTEINGNLDSNNIAEGGVVPNSLTDGTGTSWAWQSWTPTLTNVSEGSTGTITGAYTQIGKTVFFRLKVELAGTGVSVGDIRFTSPTNIAAELYASDYEFGRATYVDSGGTSGIGPVRAVGSNTLRILVDLASTTYVDVISTSSTVPHTWAAGDRFTVTGHYEAA